MTRKRTYFDFEYEFMGFINTSQYNSFYLLYMTQQIVYKIKRECPLQFDRYIEQKKKLPFIRFKDNKTDRVNGICGYGNITIGLAKPGRFFCRRENGQPLPFKTPVTAYGVYRHLTYGMFYAMRICNRKDLLNLWRENARIFDKSNAPKEFVPLRDEIWTPHAQIKK